MCSVRSRTMLAGRLLLLSQSQDPGWKWQEAGHVVAPRWAPSLCDCMSRTKRRSRDLRAFESSHRSTAPVAKLEDHTPVNTTHTTKSWRLQHRRRTRRHCSSLVVPTTGSPNLLHGATSQTTSKTRQERTRTHTETEQQRRLRAQHGSEEQEGRRGHGMEE